MGLPRNFVDTSLILALVAGFCERRHRTVELWLVDGVVRGNLIIGVTIGELFCKI